MFNKQALLDKVEGFIDSSISLMDREDSTELEDKMVILHHRTTKEDVDAILELSILVNVATEMTK